MRRRRDDDLRPVGDALDGVLSQLGVPPEVDLPSLIGDWHNVAGEPFADLARPSGLRSGELLLTVADGTTATLLRYRVGELVDRLEERFGKGRITAVRIRVATPRNGP
jgi:predicted nucleic acid-binding Zn ribbon protein